MARVELRNYRRAQSPLRTLFRLFRYFRHCRVLLICAVASILAYVACTIGASYCMRPLTNLLKESGITPNETYAKYLSLLAGLGTLYFLSAVTNYLLNRLMLETSTVIMRELRAELFARMQKLPISYFDANTNGSLMSYYTNDIEATNELLQHSITQMLISVTSLTGTIAMMLVLSMRLFAIMVVLGAIVLLVVRITTKISSHSYRAQQKNAAAVNGYIEEMIAGQRDIKVFTHEKQVMAEIIREKLLWNLEKEIPHGTAVEITKFSERDDGIIDLDATIYCEKASHKGIIIGKNGQMDARKDCERFMGTKVFLQTWVRVKENWRDSDFMISNFGYHKD